MPLPNTPYILSANAWEFITRDNYADMRESLGVGPTDSPEFANLTLTSPSLGSSAPVTISQTWNGTGSTVFTALKVNATSTASDPTSRLLDLQVGTVSQFNVRKNGQALFSSGIVSAPGITFLSGSNTGIWETSAGVHFSSAGTNAFGIRNEIRVNSSLAFGFASGTPADTGLDVALWRDAANTLALRNGANAQTFNVYGTSSASNANYARLALTCGLDGNATISTQALGTGVAGTVSVNGIVASPSGNSLTFAGSNGSVLAQSNYIILQSNTYAAVQVLGARGAGNEPSSVACQYGPASGTIDATSAFKIYRRTGGVDSVPFTVDSVGNVGIGTTAPGAKLDVYLNPANSVLTEKIKLGTGLTYGNYNTGLTGFWLTNATTPVAPSLTNYSIVGGSSSLVVNGPSSLHFATGSNYRATIDTAGNVGIGTTSPTSKLHVEDASSPTLTIKNTSATGYSQVLLANTVVPGSGFWVNGSAQVNYGGASSFNIYAAASNIAFHTATVTNALSIAQSGAATFAGSISGTNVTGTNNVVSGDFFRGTRLLLGADVVRIGQLGDGILELKDGAGSGFNRIAFGGGTSSFPSLKRVGTDFQVVLASTTAATNVAAADADLTFIEDRYRRKGAGTPEGVVTAPIGAVYHNTTGGAGTSFYVKESGTGNTGWVGK